MTKNQKSVDLSIIIVNYNSSKYLSDCLNSIYKNNPEVSFEIVVIDNASSDNSIVNLKRSYPQVKIIENRKNRGFSAANNQGLKVTTGEYVLLLNHDTEIKDKTIKNLVFFLSDNSAVGACGPKVLNSDGSIQHQCKRGFPTPLSILFYISGISKLFPKSAFFGHYLMTHLDVDCVSEVDSLSGACMLIRRKILDGINGLDEGFFLYGEDLDLCYRIKQAGWKIFYVPTAEIIHHGGVGSRTMSSKGIILFHQSMFTFYKKHYADKYFFCINWFVYLGIFLKMAINLLLNFLRREKFVGSKKP